MCSTPLTNGRVLADHHQRVAGSSKLYHCMPAHKKRQSACVRWTEPTTMTACCYAKRQSILAGRCRLQTWLLMSASRQTNTNAQLVVQSCVTACLHTRSVNALAWDEQSERPWQHAATLRDRVFWLEGAGAKRAALSCRLTCCVQISTRILRILKLENVSARCQCAWDHEQISAFVFKFEFNLFWILWSRKCFLKDNLKKSRGELTDISAKKNKNGSSLECVWFCQRQGMMTCKPGTLHENIQTEMDCVVNASIF